MYFERVAYRFTILLFMYKFTRRDNNIVVFYYRNKDKEGYKRHFRLERNSSRNYVLRRKEDVLRYDGIS